MHAHLLDVCKNNIIHHRLSILLFLLRSDFFVASESLVHYQGQWTNLLWFSEFLVYQANMRVYLTLTWIRSTAVPAPRKYSSIPVVQVPYVHTLQRTWKNITRSLLRSSAHNQHILSAWTWFVDKARYSTITAACTAHLLCNKQRTNLQ